MRIAQAPIGCVVKGDAYGHGMEFVLATLHSVSSVRWICVQTSEEAVRTRACGWDRHILVFAHDGCDLDTLVQLDIDCALYDIRHIDMLVAAARRVGKPARVQIACDVGMNYLGITLEMLPDVLSKILPVSELQITGVFAHLPDTNAPQEQVQSEIDYFYAATAACGHAVMRHIVASGALWSSTQGDLVRVGTLLYGSWKSALHEERILTIIPDISIHPIVTWKAKILQIRNVRVGDSVGYQRTFVADAPCRIAIVAVGYYDGYMRQFSHHGVVAVRGGYCPVVGIVGMNMCAIDVTAVSNISYDDEVILVGPDREISPLAQARRLSTNPNEVTSALCRVQKRVYLSHATKDHV